MKDTPPFYNPVQGKTYSLFGDSESTERYYLLINELADKFIEYYDISEIENQIDNHKPIKDYVSEFFTEYCNESGINVHDHLSIYTKEAKNHLRDISFFSFDRTLRTKENNYHFYMLEYEIVNRINRQKFLSCNYKFALLPHCLRDLNKNCKAESDGIDQVCKGCSKNCFINLASKVLREKNITPYIWMEINLKNLFRQLLKKYGSIGVFGIACIPELINGMRKCIKHGIPVVGIPLNANRCRRWMGEYHDNSFSVERLEDLVAQ